MPLYKTISLPDGQIGIWELSETSGDLLSVFSPEELEDTDFIKYTYEKRKVEWLATRALLKQMIGTDFIVSYSETGKPNLSHKRYNHISISHSRYFLAVFIHENVNVGIDIEDMTRNYSAVERKYLSDKELLAVNKNARLQCIYWCAKEAIFKLVPDDGVIFREQIHISSFDPEQEQQFSARYTEQRQESIYQLYFQSFANHYLVWVSDNQTKF